MCAAAMKYRNLTGTLMMPTNAAFDKLAQTQGIRVLDPGALTTSLLQALLEYHLLFDTIDVSTCWYQGLFKNLSTEHFL